jgi:hypothetical protein
MENTAKDFLISHYPISRESDFTKEGKDYFTLYYTVDLMECYAKQLQAKHEEELKQAVIEAYNEGYDSQYETADPIRITAEQYYQANLKTKETMKWIKVSDLSMPEVQKRVLLCYNGGAIDIGRLMWHERKVEQTSIGIEINYNTRWTHGHQGHSVDVTHWCELEPPKQ